jgi:hypothetical protein
VIETMNVLMLFWCRHGVGNWKRISEDCEFQFVNRTTIDLKDKWRNIQREHTGTSRYAHSGPRKNYGYQKWTRTETEALAKAVAK